MPRTTLNDRARKARIREREGRALREQIEKLENISPDQLATLRKIEAAMNKGDFPTTEQIPNWRELRGMGVVRMREGRVILTAVGGDVLDAEEEAKA
jgi:hypothetical protein